MYKIVFMLLANIIKKVSAAILILSLLAINSCVNLTVSQTKEYDTMMNKAKSSLNMFSGNYADIISKSIGGSGLMSTAEHKMQGDSFHIFRNYRFEVNPHGNYYDFRIIDNREWTLFDYTCTLELGSTVFMKPNSLNLYNIGLYDKCVRH